MAVMDGITRTLLLALIAGLNIVSGLSVPRPKDLQLDILDGEVTALWEHPEGAPPNFHYNVQMAKSDGGWQMVPNCKGITETYCELSSLINDYRTAYRVKVELVAGVNESAWTAKRFLPNESKLRPPSFNVYVTSSSLTVNIVPKPCLKKLFLYGLLYTIYLEKKGDHPTNTTVYLSDDPQEDLPPKTFNSLHWGQEYCVRVTVEGKGWDSTSRPSSQCLKLPDEEWYMTAVVSLSVLGVLSLTAGVAAILLCYLKSPEKTPIVLKSPLSDWHPLSIVEGTVEVVTDRGWFLSGQGTPGDDRAKAPLTNIAVAEDIDEEDRRTSMDSGVSMEPNSIENPQDRPPIRQDDSGCGSLGGQESSTSDQTTYPLQKERSQMDAASDKGDSGVGWGFQFHSSPLDEKQQDSGPLKKAVYGGNYRSQTPRDVEIDICDNKVELSQVLSDPSLAREIQGYRAGLQSCICSGAGQCTWCHRNGPCLTHTNKQYRATCAEDGLQSWTCHSVDAHGGIPFSIFSKDAQTDSIPVKESTAFPQLQETFPMLSAFTLLPPVSEGKDFNMNNMTLSLCDIQLRTD